MCLHFSWVNTRSYSNAILIIFKNLPSYFPKQLYHFAFLSTGNHCWDSTNCSTTLAVIGLLFHLSVSSSLASVLLFCIKSCNWEMWILQLCSPIFKVVWLFRVLCVSVWNLRWACQFPQRSQLKFWLCLIFRSIWEYHHFNSIKSFDPESWAIFLFI